MRTLDNHLAGVTVDQPHPEGYRPDLPLSTDETAEGEAYLAGYDEGYTAGDMAGEARIRRQPMAIVA